MTNKDQYLRDAKAAQGGESKPKNEATPTPESDPSTHADMASDLSLVKGDTEALTSAGVSQARAELTAYATGYAGTLKAGAEVLKEEKAKLTGQLFGQVPEISEDLLKGDSTAATESFKADVSALFSGVLGS